MNSGAQSAGVPGSEAGAVLRPGGDGRVPGLDLMRAIAILLVLVAHLPLGGTWNDRLFLIGSCGGVLGVDLFFALSGFLIGGILFDTGERLRSGRILAGFWLNRWLRTLPNFYLLFIVNLIIGVLIFPRRQTDWTPFVSTAFFLQNLTHAPGWFFAETWSLSIEEWFYVLLPLGLWGGLRARLSLAVSSGVMLAGLLAVPFLLRASIGEGWTADRSMAVAFRIDALAYGVAAAWISRRRSEAWRAAGPGLVWLALGLIAVAVAINLGWPETLRFRAVHAVFSVLQPLAGALLLPAFCRWPGWRAEWLNAATAATARWSYSLYLVNASVAFVIHRLWSQPIAGSLANRGLVAVSFFVICFALAAALYRFYERPFLRLRERIALCREAAAARAAALAPRPRSGVSLSDAICRH